MFLTHSLVLQPFLDSALITMKKKKKKKATKLCPDLFFHVHTASRVAQCLGSGSFGELLVSHQEYMLLCSEGISATGWPAPALHNWGVSWDNSGWVHSHGIGGIGLARRGRSLAELLLLCSTSGSTERSTGWALSSPVGPGVALWFTPAHARTEPVCEQQSKGPELVHIERAGGRGCVYGERLFPGEKSAHNHGYVFIHMWICSSRERPACSLELTEKFSDFDFRILFFFLKIPHCFLTRSQSNWTISFPR